MDAQNKDIQDMDMQNYCNGIEMELATWKTKLYDLARKIDLLPTGSKYKMLANVEDLHILVTEMDDRVDQLQTECLTEWGPHEEAVDAGFVVM
jgi:hypothetical protein